MGESQTGQVVQVIGPVVDVKFSDGNLPEINNAVVIEKNDDEKLYDKLLAETAVELALKRHAGRIATEEDAFKGFIPGIPMGRDLRPVDLIICVGGYFSHNSEKESKEIIRSALKEPGISLLPKKPRIITDMDYILFAAGNILEVDKDYSMEVLTKYFIENQTLIGEDNE